MRLVSFGCSLTWGTDLPDISFDDPLKWSQKVWPAVIASKMGMSYRSGALGGCGNLAIFDRSNKWNTINPKDFLIINWTFIDRFDYSDPAGQHYNNGGVDWLTCRPNDQNEICDFYFRTLHSEYRDKLQALNYIKSTIDHLIANKTKFIMTCIDDLIWCQRWHATSYIKYMQQTIRPYIQDFEGRNFLDWSRHRGFAISATGHPLEEAHAAAAEIMWPAIDAILHRA